MNSIDKVIEKAQLVYNNLGVTDRITMKQKSIALTVVAVDEGFINNDEESEVFQSFITLYGVDRVRELLIAFENWKIVRNMRRVFDSLVDMKDLIEKSISKLGFYSNSSNYETYPGWKSFEDDGYCCDVAADQGETAKEVIKLLELCQIHLKYFNSSKGVDV